MMVLKVAAKAVIVKDGKALVITRSSKEMQNGEFDYIEVVDLPGGIIEPGEKVEEGLRREVMEEVGLEVNVIKPIMVADHFGSGLHIVGILFLCLYKSGEIRLGPEHDEYYWVDVDELRNMDSSSWAVKRVELALEEYRRICTLKNFFPTDKFC